MIPAVRAAGLASDREQVIGLLQANLPYRTHSRYFDWSYRKNPEGEALIWVAIDPETNGLAGAAAAFPRRLYCCGTEARGYVLSDFCVDSRYRSLGVALALQRACLAGVSANASHAFDFPSGTMLAVYKRLGIETNQTMIRYAKPLRADRKVARWMSAGAVAQGVSAVANAGLRLRDLGRPPRGAWEIGPESGPWDAEFTEAARQWDTGSDIRVARTAAYLNWRYREHPERTYEMLTARQGGRLCGYLVWQAQGENGVIDDLMSRDGDVRDALLAHAAELARGRGLQTLSAPWLSAHPGRHGLESRGFCARESGPVVLMTLPVEKKSSGKDAAAWYVTAGDQDG